MNSILGTTLSLTVALIFMAPVCAVAVESDASSRGRDMYHAYGCYACHGFNGVGKYTLLPRTSGIVSNDQAFLAFLRARAEVRPSLPQQLMPHYPASSLSDGDAIEILAYIRSFSDDPPSVAQSETLRTILESAGKSGR